MDGGGKIIRIDTAQTQTAVKNATTGKPLPRLLLHCCCAPCATVALELLSPSFVITCMFFNPNIMPNNEHDKRLATLVSLLMQAKYPNRVNYCDDYAEKNDVKTFKELAKPYRDEPEGGKRCAACIELRLERTAIAACRGKYDCFATTLSVGPRKDAETINGIGARLSEKHGVEYIPSDFKKSGGFARSVELCKEYGLYRQNYCGCKTKVEV
jgi:predicted adenine nucleotide alpha hydrolase (AANH) superfamily ATPase